MPTSPIDPIHHVPPLSERLQHYCVPEGYFDNLSARILSQIPLDESLSESSVPMPQRKATLWVRLRPWISIAAALIAVVALWGVWQGGRQESPLSSSEDIALSAYDLSVSPLTDEEYAAYLYDSYVDLLVEDDALGVSLTTASELDSTDDTEDLVTDESFTTI